MVPVTRSRDGPRAARADSARRVAGPPADSASVVDIDELDPNSILNQMLPSQLEFCLMQNGMGLRSDSIHDNRGSVMRLEEPITVTSEQLNHFRDTLVRANDALHSAKTRALELARTLHNEQIAVRDVILALIRMTQSDRLRET